MYYMFWHNLFPCCVFVGKREANSVTATSHKYMQSIVCLASRFWCETLQSLSRTLTYNGGVKVRPDLIDPFTQIGPIWSILPSPFIPEKKNDRRK